MIEIIPEQVCDNATCLLHRGQVIDRPVDSFEKHGSKGIGSLKYVI